MKEECVVIGRPGEHGCQARGCDHPAYVRYASDSTGLYMWVTQDDYFGTRLCHCHAMAAFRAAFGEPCPLGRAMEAA